MRRATAVLFGAMLFFGCGREERVFHVPPTSNPAGPVRMTPLQPGPPTADVALSVYDENRWAVAEGQRLFSWYNCTGCHASAGGGAIGPPLRDDEWIYGSDPENIFRSIMEGRPNGMPAFEGRVHQDDVWKLVAYVRTLAGMTPRDVWPARADASDDANPRPAR